MIPGVDWSTVLVSTALSALVGTLVSLAAVSQTTTRQRKAERRDQAPRDQTHREPGLSQQLGQEVRVVPVEIDEHDATLWMFGHG